MYYNVTITPAVDNPRNTAPIRHKLPTAELAAAYITGFKGDDMFITENPGVHPNYGGWTEVWGEFMWDTAWAEVHGGLFTPDGAGGEFMWEVCVERMSPQV